MANVINENQLNVEASTDGADPPILPQPPEILGVEEEKEDASNGEEEDIGPLIEPAEMPVDDVNPPAPLITLGQRPLGFEIEHDRGTSLLRHLEGIVGDPVFPVTSTNILIQASTLPSADFNRTVRVAGGVVPTFAAWDDGRITFYYPQKLRQVTDGLEISVFPRGVKYSLRDDQMSFLTMDRRVVILNTNSRSTQIIAPGQYDVLPDGAIISPCDLSIEELQTYFTRLGEPIHENELLNRAYALDQFKDQNYFECYPLQAMKLNADAEAAKQRYFDNSLPPNIGIELGEGDILRGVIRSLNALGYLEDIDANEMSQDELTELYRQLVRTHPELLSHSPGSLGSGFETIKTEKLPDLIRLKQETTVLHGTYSEDGKSLDIVRDTPNLTYKLHGTVLEVYGVRNDNPIPLEWGSLTYHHCSAGLHRLNSILTTTAKLGHCVFVRLEADGACGVKVNSAQPNKRSSKIKGSKLDKFDATWMERLDARFTGEMVIPIACNGATPSMFAIIQDAQDLIFQELLLNGLDPSNFGALKTGFVGLAVDPSGNRNYMCGENFGYATLCSAYAIPVDTQKGSDHVLMCIEHIGKPVGPACAAYGLPSCTDAFIHRRIDRPVCSIVYPNKGSLYESDDLPLLRVRDTDEEGTPLNTFRDLPLPHRINENSEVKRLAIETYASMVQQGARKSDVATSSDGPDLAVAQPSTTLVVYQAQEGDGAAMPAPPNAGAEAPANLNHETTAAQSSAPIGGQTTAATQSRGRTNRNTGGTYQVPTPNPGFFLRDDVTSGKAATTTSRKPKAIKWLGAFSHCPNHRRQAWKDRYIATLWLARDREPQNTVHLPIRSKLWTNPLRDYSLQVDLPASNGTLSKEELKFLTVKFDPSRFSW